MSWLGDLFSRTSSDAAIRGGLALTRNKPGLTDLTTIESLDIPREVVIPLLSYRREYCEPQITVGDTVTLGDSLSHGILASTSGVVTAIENRPIIHPSNRQETCVVIETTLDEVKSVHPPLAKLTLQRMEACGVMGLGGAGFDTAEKFRAGVDRDGTLATLIINAVECEPMISCDEALMITRASDIISAVQSLLRLFPCSRCILAVENDKIQAIHAIQSALNNCQLTSQRQFNTREEATLSSKANTPPVTLPAIELMLLQPVYPSGAERPLVERTTGIQLSADQKPVDHGIVCINVATALAAWRAQLGEPLISRIITIAGAQAKHPVNVRVRFGTRLIDVLRMSGNSDYAPDSRVRVGGPLSGFDVDNLSAPVTATTNCILIEAPQDTQSSLDCIRCSACSEVCPVSLLPQQLYWHARADDLKKSLRYGINSCIECGCCDVVCPSRIPLTQTFRYARDAIREQQRQHVQATLAEQRFKQRETRLQARKNAREEKRLAARARLHTATDDPISDALKRAQARRKSSRKKGSTASKSNHPNGDLP